MARFARLQAKGRQEAFRGEGRQGLVGGMAKKRTRWGGVTKNRKRWDV